MDNQESNNTKDLPIYHWHNKEEEGKEEYARFAKQFKLYPSSTFVISSSLVESNAVSVRILVLLPH